MTAASKAKGTPEREHPGTGVVSEGIEAPADGVEREYDLDDVEQVELADQDARDAKAIANVPEQFHDQAKAEGWAEGQQGPFVR
jgi:flagellar biosynthesis/type III secretory pathway protein FliH